MNSAMSSIKSYLVEMDAACSDLKSQVKMFDMYGDALVARQPGVERVQAAMDYIFGGSLKVRNFRLLMYVFAASI